MPGPLLNALCGLSCLFPKQHFEIDIITIFYLQTRTLRLVEVSNSLKYFMNMCFRYDILKIPQEI